MSEPVPRVPVHYHLLAVALPLFLIGLATTRRLEDKGTFSLAPFQYLVRYELGYSFVDAAGQRHRLTDHPDLHGKARRVLLPRRPKNFLYNVGELRSRIEQYLEYLHTHGEPGRYVAHLRYQVGLEGEWQVVTLSYPEEPGE